MTVEALKYYYLKELSNIYPKEEILSFYYMLMEFKLGYSKSDTVLNAHEEIKNGDFRFFKTALSDLKTEKPIQYIIGETGFYGLRFKVDSSVLIPRPETEELVEWIISDVENEMMDLRDGIIEQSGKRQEKGHQKQETGDHGKNQKIRPTAIGHRPMTVLDIGTGSGCIAIALAKNLPNAEIYALDVSAEALGIARENAFINTVNVRFVKADILEDTLNELPKFDIIVSNPPYVRISEKKEMKDNVLKHEPHLALFVKDNDPLVFYRRIISLAQDKLKKNGSLYFEINQYLAEETKMLTDLLSARTEIREDLKGNKRMLKIPLS